MNRNQRLLIALSGTEQDQHLLQYARLLASHQVGREFRFVHVAPILGSTEGNGRHPSPETHDRIQQAVEQHFGPPPAGTTASCHVVGGERIDALLEFATISRTDLILLGHRQQRSGQRSLARRLAMMAPASVWMVPEKAPVSLRTILAPVDFSRHSADALNVATGLAVAAEAQRCLALHVYFDRSTVRYPEQVIEERKNDQSRFQEFLQNVNAQGFALESRVEEGPQPPRTILRVAAEEQTDLIVMSTRGRSQAAAVLLGSVTTQVMVESPVAVLAVKHFGAALGIFQALKDAHTWQGGSPKTN